MDFVERTEEGKKALAVLCETSGAEQKSALQTIFSSVRFFLFFVYDDEKLIACGGLNQQWNENEIDTRIGRVRRFYVLPKYRKHGVGKQLLQHLEKQARANFSALCLSIDTKAAASFYQKQNYVFVENHPNYSYFKYLL